MRVCSYSLSDITLMAILSSARNTAIDKVLAEDDPDPKQPFVLIRLLPSNSLSDVMPMVILSSVPEYPKFHYTIKNLCNKVFVIQNSIEIWYKHLITNFSDLFKRFVNSFKRAGYTLDSMRQTACLVFNPLMVEGYAALFSCTAVVQATDSMTASM